MPTQDHNVHPATVEDFGREWAAFGEGASSEAELRREFESYFRTFPWDSLPSAAEGVDVGCGSGRWARFVARRVGLLHCADPSAQALGVAARNLGEQRNVRLHRASANDLPLPDGSLDFAYSIGVLHAIPDPQSALSACARKLRRGAPFLVYTYYAVVETRPWWFRGVWRVAEAARRIVSRFPFRLKLWLTTGIAAVVYWPLGRLSRLLERLGLDVSNVPLSAYRLRSFYFMRTDALDRFGTRRERRFTSSELRQMMEAAGLERVTIEGPPYWLALGFKR
jgi:ubiquinone/menaquinone biosynthesis C-methylase UbiE